MISNTMSHWNLLLITRDNFGTETVSPSEIFEDGGITTVSASLSATYNKNVTVNLSMSGTASGDSTDYILDSQTIKILAGDTIGSTTISAVQDADYEGNETII